jgi:hypothetical protein
MKRSIFVTAVTLAASLMPWTPAATARADSGPNGFAVGGGEAFFFGTTFHFAFSAHQVSPTSTTPLAAKGYVVVTANNQTAIGPVQCLSVRGPGAAIVFLQQERERPARGLCAIGCWGGRRDLGAVRRHLTHASSGSPQARPAQPTARPRTRVRPAGCRREQPRPPRGLHRKSCMSPLIADAIPETVTTVGRVRLVPIG